MTAAFLLTPAALLWAAAEPDVYFLLSGDRITGRTVSITKRSFGVQTAFGRLTIPRSRIHKVRKADGTEQVLNQVSAAEESAATPAPAAGPPPARLALIITGHTFWFAWDPKEHPDPRLRLEVSVDEELAAAYVDATVDPEIKGYLVNAFSFAAEDVTVEAGQAIVAHPPEARPGRVSLKLDVPAAAPGPRKLRLAYQINVAAAEQPAWKDMASVSADVLVQPGLSSLLQVRQDRGRMELAGFPRRRMQHTDSFKLEVSAE